MFLSRVASLTFLRILFLIFSVQSGISDLLMYFVSDFFSVQSGISDLLMSFVSEFFCPEWHLLHNLMCFFSAHRAAFPTLSVVASRGHPPSRPTRLTRGSVCPHQPTWPGCPPPAYRPPARPRPCLNRQLHINSPLRPW